MNLSATVKNMQTQKKKKKKKKKNDGLDFKAARNKLFSCSGKFFGGLISLHRDVSAQFSFKVHCTLYLPLFENRI